jgi:hypothetical protein
MQTSTKETVSFEQDIVPIFRQFRGSMMWRLDLTRYEDVKQNASTILAQFQQKNMPPPPYPLLTDQQIAMFQAWMDQGFPK